MQGGIVLLLEGLPERRTEVRDGAGIERVVAGTAGYYHVADAVEVLELGSGFADGGGDVGGHIDVLEGHGGVAVAEEECLPAAVVAVEAHLFLLVGHVGPVALGHHRVAHQRRVRLHVCHQEVLTPFQQPLARHALVGGILALVPVTVVGGYCRQAGQQSDTQQRQSPERMDGTTWPKSSGTPLRTCRSRQVSD